MINKENKDPMETFLNRLVLVEIPGKTFSGKLTAVSPDGGLFFTGRVGRTWFHGRNSIISISVIDER